MVIKSEGSDQDMIFKGNDGGVAITAMTIDMSAGGKVGIGTTSPNCTLTVDGSANIIEEALVDGATAVNALTQQNCTLVLQENTTIGAPSNGTAGQILVFEIAQHASSGPYTLAWNTVFEFAASTAPTMTATDAKTDIFTFRYNGSVWQEIGRSQNMAQT